MSASGNNENIEPTQKGTLLAQTSGVEIEEYAEFLGMDLAEDRDLLWIAEQGVPWSISNR